MFKNALPHTILMDFKSKPLKWTIIFSTKFIIWIFWMTICIYSIIVIESILWRLIPQCLLGLAFAHGVELQHQALHHTGFRSKKANHWAGFMLGLPMLVCYTAYRDSHLFHHQALGRYDDEEFFKHSEKSTLTIFSILKQICMVGHFYSQLRMFVAAFKRPALPVKIAASDAAVMRKEYLLMGAIFFSAAMISLLALSYAFIQCWLIPLLLFAAPVHYLIEFPEHYGCDKSSRLVVCNTRTIHTHRLMSWFTNGNNYHIEHHTLPALPMEQLARIHQHIKGELRHYCRSYYAFYRQLVIDARKRRAKGSRPIG